MCPSVLVVDDDQDIRESLAQILTEEGFEVTSASNGAEALEEIDRRAPDIMLLDLMMPVVNGWEVLEKLRLRGPKLPVVVLSAVDGHEHPDFIQKPILLPKLLALIDTLRTRVAESKALRSAARAPPEGGGD